MKVIPFWIVLATLCVFLHFSVSVYRLFIRKKSLSTLWNYLLLLLAIIFQTMFLHEQGELVGQCPITNIFETMMFLSWAFLLSYLTVGIVCRAPVLALIVSPLVFFINLLAVLLPLERVGSKIAYGGWMYEAHAIFLLLACGALGLATFSAVLYIVQERQIKKRIFGDWFYNLPSMGDLGVVQIRLLGWGFLLFTVGVVFGFLLLENFDNDLLRLSRVFWVWLFFGVLVVGPKLLNLSAKKIAWGIIFLYGLLVLVFWGMQILSIGNN